MNNSGIREGFLQWDRTAVKTHRSRPARKRRFSLPATLFEFQQEYVLGARILRTPRKVARLALATIETGVISPLLGRPNILKPEEVTRTIAAVVKVLGSDKGPFGLLLPDAAVRVSILDFKTLPADQKEQESLIRWKMKSLLPYPAEEARLSFELAPQGPDGVKAVILAVRRSVAAEYESLLDSLNGDVQLVLPTTAALLPLLSDHAREGELLLHVSPSQMTAVVVGDKQIRMWRNQAMDNAGSPEERLVVVSQEAARMLAASHDHLGLEIDVVRFCARPKMPEEWTAGLSRAISREVENLVLDPLAAGIKLSDEEKLILSELGATFSGLVANAS